MIENILIYYGTWLFPSGTVVYMVLREKYKYGRLTSYIISGLVAGTMMYPVQKYVFGN